MGERLRPLPALNWPVARREDIAPTVNALLTEHRIIVHPSFVFSGVPRAWASADADGIRIRVNLSMATADLRAGLRRLERALLGLARLPRRRKRGTTTNDVI
jgi:hypothetical protein